MLKDAKGYTFREAGASETGDRHLGIDLDHQADLGLCPSYPKSHKLRVYVVRLVLESKLEKIRHRFSCSCHEFARSAHSPQENQGTASKQFQHASNMRWKTCGILSVSLSLIWLRHLGDSDGTYGAFNLSVSVSNGQRKLEFLGWEAEWCWVMQSLIWPRGGIALWFPLLDHSDHGVVVDLFSCPAMWESLLEWLFLFVFVDWDACKDFCCPKNWCPTRSTCFGCFFSKCNRQVQRL